MTILFYHEKIFDLDGIYNSENHRIWAVNREETNRRGGKKQKGKFAEKVMGWSEGVARLVLFEKGTLHHHQRSTACCSTIRFGNNWTFEQDKGTARITGTSPIGILQIRLSPLASVHRTFDSIPSAL